MAEVRSMTDNLRAPVQGFSAGIPWSLHLRAWDRYAEKYGRSQSAERLAERGGFGASELDVFVPGWRDEVSEITRLQEALAAAEARICAKDEALEHARHVMWEYGFSENDLQPVREAIDLAVAGSAILPAVLAETRKKALEEAAQVAENTVDFNDDGLSTFDAAQIVTAAIRALSQEQSK